MKNIPNRCFIITFRIWLLAVLFNTIGVTIAMDALDLLPFTLGISALYSFPVLILLFILLNVMVQHECDFATCFTVLLLTGIVSGLLALRLFSDGINMLSGLTSITVGSAACSILTQFKAIKTLTSYSNPVDDFLKDSNQ